ncbi:MAG: hypothetical protein JNJ54_10770 [Myxococcaceae bacterium]|nr:hypothetical protein [Myxococcaceae bacterium]
MKIGSFDTSTVTSKLSSAVESVEKKVEAKVSSTVDSVRETASDVKIAVVRAEARVESFARSEYEQAKDFARVTGQRIEQKVDGAVQAMKDGAKELPSFKVPQGVKDLGSRLFGEERDSSRRVEGGTNWSQKNSGKPDEVVDLNDKEKFLSTYGQKDQLDSTRSDEARCQSNTIIAALLMKGGPEEVKKGLSAALATAREQQASETDPNRKKALDRAVTNLQSAVDGLSAGKVTRGQLDKAADAMWTLMVPARENDRQHFDKDGDPVGGITGISTSAIREMEKTVGLTDGSAPVIVKEKWFAPFTDDNREVSDKVWDKIEPGKSAHVATNLYGEHKATGLGPDGKPITISGKGQPYIYENGEMKLLNAHAQHAVLFGKNADGTRYIYNPLADPPYLTEKKGDKASSEKLDAMAANLMGLQKGKSSDSNDWQAEVTAY